jgi:hypothetical protein
MGDAKDPLPVADVAVASRIAILPTVGVRVRRPVADGPCGPSSASVLGCTGELRAPCEGVGRGRTPSARLEDLLGQGPDLWHRSGVPDLG